MPGFVSRPTLRSLATQGTCIPRPYTSAHNKSTLSRIPQRTVHCFTTFCYAQKNHLSIKSAKNSIFKGEMDRPAKRQRVEDPQAHALESLQRPISPPRRRQREVSTIKSPWHLTWIQDLPEEDNRDAVSLRDLLGDPLIAECWEFNFLHDIHFLMDAFDSDTRHLVKVHVVHGFWKREDEGRIAIEVRCSRANPRPGRRSSLSLFSRLSSS